MVNELLMYGGSVYSAMISMLHSYCSLMWRLEQVRHVPGTIINYRGVTLLSILYKLYTSTLRAGGLNLGHSI